MADDLDAMLTDADNVIVVPLSRDTLHYSVSASAVLAAIDSWGIVGTPGKTSIN